MYNVYLVLINDNRFIISRFSNHYLTIYRFKIGVMTYDFMSRYVLKLKLSRYRVFEIDFISTFLKYSRKNKMLIAGRGAVELFFNIGPQEKSNKYHSHNHV